MEMGEVTRDWSTWQQGLSSCLLHCTVHGRLPMSLRLGDYGWRMPDGDKYNVMGSCVLLVISLDMQSDNELVCLIHVLYCKLTQRLLSESGRIYIGPEPRSFFFFSTSALEVEFSQTINELNYRGGIRGSWVLRNRGKPGWPFSSLVVLHSNWRTMVQPVLCCACLALCDPTDCSPPGSSVHEVSPGKNTEVGCHPLFQGIFPIQELNWGLLLFRRATWEAHGSACCCCC